MPSLFLQTQFLPQSHQGYQKYKSICNMLYQWLQACCAEEQTEQRMDIYFLWQNSALKTNKYDSTENKKEAGNLLRIEFNAVIKLQIESEIWNWSLQKHNKDYRFPKFSCYCYITVTPNLNIIKLYKEPIYINFNVCNIIKLLSFFYQENNLIPGKYNLQLYDY